MFIKKNRQSSELKLSDVVKQVTNSGYVFDRINGDLGEAADEIKNSSKSILMSYGYARRLAAAALYLQGYWKKEDYEYVKSIFKSLQINTDTSPDFQEQALADAIIFMQTYHHMINTFFAKKLILIAQEYEVPPGYLNDGELIKSVLDTVYKEQELTLNSKGYETSISRIIGMDSLTNSPPSIYTNHNESKSQEIARIQEITSILQKLSDSDSQKIVTIWIAPLEKSWSYEFHFSSDEMDTAQELTSEIYALMEGKVEMPTFAYQPK